VTGFFQQTGSVLTCFSSHGGNSSSDISVPSDSMPSPVDFARAEPIHTYGCGAYRTLVRTASDLSGAGRMSNMTLPETKAVPPSGTSSSSPEPSS